MKCSGFWAAAMIVATVLALGCNREKVLKRDLADGIVLEDSYRYMDRRSGALELVPRRQFLVVDGNRFEFANPHMAIAEAYRSCSRVFLVLLNNYGYFLVILENDGSMTPVMQIGGPEEKVVALECQQVGGNLTLRLSIKDPVEGTRSRMTRKVMRSGAFPGL